MHTTVRTQYATYVFPIYSLYIVHTDSQLYFDKYKMCVQNKCTLRTLYMEACTYSIYIAYVDILYVLSLLFTF